jgi:RNA polymerase sigma-70 factor (ECF subfamily)
MSQTQETDMIKGLQTGGTTQRRYENELWQQFSWLIKWGKSKYLLSDDEVRLAYDDTICSAIINIINRKFEGNGHTQLKAYVGKIFEYKCFDHLRQLKRHQNILWQEKKFATSQDPAKDGLTEDLPDGAKNAIETIIQNEEQSRLQRCLTHMGEPCKQILQLHALGCKDKDIAVHLHYNSADVAKQSRLRCLKKLSLFYLNPYRCE